MSEQSWQEARAALTAACQHRSQADVGRAMGYSGAVVSLVLRDCYTGNKAKVEAAIRGALMAETVECPILGEIGKVECVRHQGTKPSANGDPIRAALNAECPTCPFALGGHHA